MTHKIEDLDPEYQEDLKFGDPEMGDWSDPEYELELFRIFRHMGLIPESFPDAAFAEKYAAWLKSVPPDPE